MNITKLYLAILACVAALLAGCSSNDDNGGDNFVGYNIRINFEGSGSSTVTVNGKVGRIAQAGDQIIITAIPIDKFQFVRWDVTSGGVTFEDPAVNPTSFIMPAADVSIKATFEKKEILIYDLTITSGGNGSAEARIDGTVVTQAMVGDIVEVTATSDEGYEFEKWELVEGEITIEDIATNPISFEMPRENVSLMACFKVEESDVLEFITDPAFKAFVEYCIENGNEYSSGKWDSDNNGKLSYAEAAVITYINIRGGYDLGNGKVPVASLKGIEFFTGLTRLECAYNQLRSLDLSHNTNLTYIDCRDNMLTSLNISNSKWLTFFRL